jgi:predicted DNA binding protein
MEVLAHTPQERGCSVVLKRDKGESGRIYLGSTIDVAACPLIVMKSFGILPSVVDTTQDGFIVDGYTNDEKSIWEMVSELREVTSEVKVQKVGSPSTSSCHDEYQGVNLDELTEKQREAVELAYENGYFDRPKNKTLEQISEELNISSQALSRRLGRVEKEIFTQLLRD